MSHWLGPSQATGGDGASECKGPSARQILAPQNQPRRPGAGEIHKALPGATGNRPFLLVPSSPSLPAVLLQGADQAGRTKATITIHFISQRALVSNGCLEKKPSGAEQNQGLKVGVAGNG